MLTTIERHEVELHELSVMLADSFRKEGFHAVSDKDGILKIFNYVFVLEDECSSFRIIENLKCIVPLRFGFEVIHSMILQFMFRNVSISVQNAVKETILGLGIKAHLKGYDYITAAICMAVNDPTLKGRIMQKIYPVIAEEFKTNSGRVERSIRYAINTAYENRKELLCESLMHEKPSPSMIIWNTADEVRRKYSALLEKTGVRI